MDYVSINYYLLVIAAVAVYYILPKKIRWTALLAGRAAFYWFAVKDLRQIGLFVFTILVGYVGGRVLEKARKKYLLWIFAILGTAPLIAIRIGDLSLHSLLHRERFAWIIPLGLAYYSLQLISYLTDVCKGKCEAQHNPLKYTLFMSFFPQIVQGPIPRYKSISTQLFEGHKFDYDAMVLGLVRLGWGFFLKFMIADKAAVVVNTVFDNSSAYTGAYLWVAAFLYSIQIYADFAGCVAMCKGVAELFGIQLADNFRQPYFSVSIREFWRRWHISFSSWLKDYIYIPLGGSRKGKIRRFLNVIITFAVSGLWHGGNLHFIAWGLIHAGYQIVGDFLNPVWKKITKSSESDAASTATVILNRCITFVLVMLSWVMFRAVSLREGLQMYLSMFTHFNPWILVDSSLLRLGLCWQEWIVLTVSILVLLGVSIMKEQGKDVRALLAGQNLVVRWAVYFIFIWSIWIFGTYGFGFDANAFIYGGF